jgi:Bcr/CflA subfamily drug resistance transporter
MTIQISTSQKRHIFILLLIIPFLMGTGVDLYVPSLPAIAHYFHAQKHLVQLTIGLYMLGYASGQLLLGILSDSLGRKKILVMSGIMFTLISFLSVFSISITMLIICRFLQGFAIAGAAVVCRAIVTDCFSGLMRISAMTYLSTSWALGPILGPFIGGYLQHCFNWQADFYFFGIYGLLTFTYAAVVLAETNIYLVPLVPIKIRHTLNEIVTHPLFIGYSIIGSLIYSMLVVFNTIAPFIIQETLHYSAVAYGHAALFLGLGYFIGNLSNSRMIRHLKSEKIVFFSLFGTIIMAIIMVIVGLMFKLNIYIILIPTFFLFYFCGLAFPNIMTMSVGFFPDIRGTASAIFGCLVSAGVFTVTTFITFLKTETQIFMALMYLVICLISLILFYRLQIINNKLNNKNL